MIDLVLKWKPQAWGEELIQITSGIGPYLDKRLIERKAWLYRKQFPTRGDKAARASSIRARMAMKGLFVPVRAAWSEPFQNELMRFPTARHDDQVDALGLVGQLLDEIHVAPPKTPKPAETKSSGYEAYKDEDMDPHFDDNLLKLG
jgi:predicted phage terminase large subunit-like protein